MDSSERKENYVLEDDAMRQARPSTLGDDAVTRAALVRGADTRMYDAKRLGKNKVAVGGQP